MKGGPSHQPKARLRGLMEFEGERVLLCGLLHQNMKNVRVAQVGQVPLIARRAAWAPSCVVVDGVSELRLGGSHIWVGCSAVGVAQAVAKVCRTAAGVRKCSWGAEQGV